MINVEQEVVYWRNTAEKDLQFASRLIARADAEETLYSLFFLHLALEKVFKAYIVKRTKKLPPKIHNLLILAEMGEVTLSEEQNDFCGKINLYNIESHYPNLFIPTPTLEKAKEYLEQTKELMEWLIKQL